ncbi:MAG: rhomboid family intramembrane serine protease [Flavobacteriales bacterium]
MSITLAIIGLTVIVSLLALRDQRVFEELLFAPFRMQAGKGWYRFLSHGLIHGGVMHLVVNMYVLWMFGSAVEDAFGALGGGMAAYLALYIGGLVLSAVPGYFKYRDDPNYRAVGASGATSAVVFAFILLNPSAKLMLIFLPIPMAAWLFGLLYLAYEWYMSKQDRDGIAHDAHYFGALYGIAFTALVDRQAVPHFIHAVFPAMLF